METRDLTAFEELRTEVCGVTTDQGAEKDICDQSVNIVPGIANRYASTDHKSYLWPGAMYVAGHMHLMYNALEEACKSLTISETFFNCLSIMCSFLGDKILRGKFQQLCLAGKGCASKFDHFPRIHCDWRWEFMKPACDGVLQHWNDIVAHFNAQKLLESETGKLSRQVIGEVEAVIRQSWLFPALACMFSVFAAIIDKYASRLEGCHCHSAIWTQKRKWTARARQVAETTGFTHCVWKTRQAAWWVAVGFQQMLHDIQNWSSCELDAMIDKLRDDRKPKVLKWTQEMAARLTEILRQKMGFWFHIPWKAVGIFWGFLDPEWPAACWRLILKECIQEYDAAIASGRKLALHRVARKLFDSETPCGRQLRELLQDESKGLADFPFAYWAILSYALIPIIERSVEAMHAILKRIGRTMSNVNPPTLSSRLRESANLKRLKSDPAFWNFCLQHYRDRGLWDQILVNQCSKTDLDDLTASQKLQKIYQCDRDSQYLDLTESRENQHLWDATVAGALVPLPDV